jgi:hypothetical protein
MYNMVRKGGFRCRPFKATPSQSLMLLGNPLQEAKLRGRIGQGRPK